MNPLLRRLAVLRLKVRVLDGWQGMCALVTLVLAVGVSVGAVDYFFHLPTLFRAAVLVGLLVGSAAIVYRYLIRPFGKPCDDLNLALRIEDEYPELNDALASTVQFLKQTKGEQARLGGSEAMRDQTVQDAVNKAASYDFSRVLHLRAGFLFGVAALCVIGLSGWVFAAYRPYAQIAFWRLVEPFGMHTWTQVAVYRAAPFDALDGDKDKQWEPLDAADVEKDRIAIGRPYIIKVNLTGQIPKHARVEVVGKIPADIPIQKLQPGDDDQSAWFVTPINMTQQYQTFKFRVVANDGSYPPRSGAWHVVEVMHKPKLIDLDGKPSPQIEISPPAYTDLPSPVKLLPGIRNLELLAGTRAVYRARADRPLVQAFIRWQPEDAHFHEMTHALGGAAVWDKVHAKLEEDGSVFSIPLLPWASGTYVLYMRDKYGLESEESADIRVAKDPTPVVRLIRPAATAEFAPDAAVPFKFLVSDEKFAVKSVFVEYRRRAQDGKDIDAEPTRVYLYDASTHGKLIPQQLAQALGLKSQPGDLRLRQPRLGFDMTWMLRNQFKQGEVVVVEVCADDFCNIYPIREPGRSHQIELRIISKNQIIADAERKLREIQNDLQRAAKLEQKAMDAVKLARKDEKIDQAAKDRFNDNADQPQKDVRDIIGKDATEGLRGDLAKLRQTLKANNLENTQPFRDAGAIKGALDNIAQEELQQLEPKMQQIRSELNHNEKNNAKIQNKLDETAKLQQNVTDTLNELIGKMDPTAKARDQRVELRDIIAKEQQLREDLAKLKTDKKKADDDGGERYKDSNEKEFKAKVQQKAEEQKDLGQRLEKLLKEMKAEQQNQEKLGHKEDAKKIEEAIKNIEQPNAAKPKEEPKLPLNAQMKKVAEDLKNKSEPPDQALNQQQDIAKGLEKALDALEGKNPDMARQEIQNRKDAEKKLDQHAKELKRLQEEEKKADQIKDMQERLKKKQEIAEQLAELQQKMEKTRRELARLQEQQAANAVKEAIKNVEKAEQKAKMGENAQQEEQAAQDKLKEAKNDVRDSEEELAREMLIRMADQLKGLKERQDASLKRSEDLHPKVMKLKSWTQPLLDTLDGNLETQKGIAEETGDLQKKMEGAVVFGGILERAKKSMDRAGELLDSRKTQGKDRVLIVDGKKMDAEEIAEENELQGDTVKNQKQASRSLTNLLDALKEEIDKKKKPQVAKNDEKPPPENDDQPKGGVPEQDGIPPMAQLKALKAEQLDLNERTIDFDKRNPDATKLDDKQRAELRELENEQLRLQELFERLTEPPQQLPMPKEGDKK